MLNHRHWRGRLDWKRPYIFNSKTCVWAGHGIYIIVGILIISGRALAPSAPVLITPLLLLITTR